MWFDWSPEGINYSSHRGRPPAAAAAAAESQARQTETNVQIQKHEMMLATTVSHQQLAAYLHLHNIHKRDTWNESWISGRAQLFRGVFKLCFHLWSTPYIDLNLTPSAIFNAFIKFFSKNGSF